jgi:predicted O-methyltransferase YrrM
MISPWRRPGWRPCLEIGSYCGKSAVYLGSACRENGSRFSFPSTTTAARRSSSQEKNISIRRLLDFSTFCPNTFPLFRQTIARSGLEETVVPIVSRSDVVARSWATPLSLVFIDGGHAFETARTDFESWARHIVPGGYLLIHDIFEKPEQGGQAPWEVYEIAVASGRFEELPRIETLGVLRRKADGSVRLHL